MPVDYATFLKGEKGKRFATGGLGPKIVAAMKEKAGYTKKELAKLVGCEEKELKNVLAYLEYRKHIIESRNVANEKVWAKVNK